MDHRFIGAGRPAAEPACHSVSVTNTPEACFRRCESRGTRLLDCCAVSNAIDKFPPERPNTENPITMIDSPRVPEGTRGPHAVGHARITSLRRSIVQASRARNSGARGRCGRSRAGSCPGRAAPSASDLAGRERRPAPEVMTARLGSLRSRSDALLDAGATSCRRFSCEWSAVVCLSQSQGSPCEPGA